MPLSGPNFSPYPFARLRRMTIREAAFESAIARWLAARPVGATVAALVGGPVRIAVRGWATSVDPDAGAVPSARLVAPSQSPAAETVHARPSRGNDRGAAPVLAPREPRVDVCAATVLERFDPNAALAEVRVGGLGFVVGGASHPIRALAQRVLGGPPELAAPRPLTPAEHAIWVLAIAAAIEDTGVAAEVWPFVDEVPADHAALDLDVELAGAPLSVRAWCPPGLAVRAPPPRAWPAWTFAIPVLVGACGLPRETLAQLAVRDVITLERRLALVIGAGTVGLSATTGAVSAEVVTGYVPRDMALPDDAHLELTVQLGTTQLSIRQLAELAPGQIVSLGRPLAGPFEVRAAGRLVGQGELVDVDGELGVRIVSLQE